MTKIIDDAIESRGQRQRHAAEHQQGRQFAGARDLAFGASVVEAFRGRLFCPFLTTLSLGHALSRR